MALLSAPCMGRLSSFLSSVHDSAECAACYSAARIPGGDLSAGTGAACSKCRCVLRVEELLRDPTGAKVNTCIGRIFQSTVGDDSLGDEAFVDRCPLCDEFDGCRQLLLDAYGDMVDNANATTCTRPNLAVNVTEAAKADTFVALFLREQMLSTCNVTAKDDATGTTYTNYFARLRQNEFRESLGTGAYCETRDLPEVGNRFEAVPFADTVKLGENAKRTRAFASPAQTPRATKTEALWRPSLQHEDCVQSEKSTQGYRWFDADGGLTRPFQREWENLARCLGPHPVRAHHCTLRQDFCASRTDTLSLARLASTARVCWLKIICPAGSFCPESSSQPIPCGPLGTCSRDPAFSSNRSCWFFASS